MIVWMYQQVQNVKKVDQTDAEKAKWRSVATPDVETAYLHVDWIWATLPYIILFLRGEIYLLYYIYIHISVHLLLVICFTLFQLFQPAAIYSLCSLCTDKIMIHY